MDEVAENFLPGVQPQIFKDYEEITARLKKTMYYGMLPPTERSSLPLTGISVRLFTKAVPDDSLDALDMHYASNVSRQACITPCSMMLAMVYLEQLRLKNPEYLQSVSSCDLFLVSMLVASKFLYDEGEEDDVFNGEWAQSANIDVKDLNKLEREFLAAISWELFIKPSEFSSLLSEVERRIALSESSKRGWLTYTDLWVLSKTISKEQFLSILMENVVKVAMVASVAYVAAVFTIVAASEISRRSCLSQHGFLQRNFDHYRTSDHLHTEKFAANQSRTWISDRIVLYGNVPSCSSSGLFGNRCCDKSKPHFWDSLTELKCLNATAVLESPPIQEAAPYYVWLSNFSLTSVI